MFLQISFALICAHIKITENLFDVNSTWTSATYYQLSFPFLIWLIYFISTTTISQVFSCHGKSTNTQKSRYKHGTTCFYKRHMPLSYVMLLPWFISMYPFAHPVLLVKKEPVGEALFIVATL